ncbi:hypothetical protein [Nocardioides sp.]|uniref:hypothetical protein n=1 Tax=Nocardioides sp. TaxID=35761 RepID=UPI0031FEF142|nr:hypothetical protein [Nocardioides sp.]
MTDRWTDDELQALLSETFASRESLADPETAQTLAASVPALGRPKQHRWPTYVAAATAVVAIAGIGAYAVTQADTETPVGNPSPSSSRATSPPLTRPSHPPQRTYAENRAAAAAESARVVELAPLPASAVGLDRRPDGWPVDYGMSLGPSDGTLTRTAWWSVPLGADTLESYLLAHHPQGLRREDGVGGGAVGIRDVNYDQAGSPDPEAFTGVSLLVQWREVDGRSLVRVDTYLAARAVRTMDTYIDETVTAVDIEQVSSGFERDGGGPLPTVHLSEPEDHARIARLVETVNGLHASTRPVPMGSCPYPGNPRPSVTVTFHTTSDEIVLHLELSCWGQVSVQRDGRLVVPTLDPAGFYPAVEKAAHAL